MSLKELLLNDLKEAMKNKDTIRKGVITVLRNDLQTIEKEGKREVAREDEIAVLRREIKQNTDIIKEAKKGNRTDIVELAETKIKIVYDYLPEQINEAQVKELLTSLPVTKEMKFKDIMESLQKAVDGASENSVLAKVVNGYLKS